MKKTVFLLIIILLVSVNAFPVKAEADFSGADGEIGETYLGTPSEIVKKILDNSLDLGGESIAENAFKLFFSALTSMLPNVLGILAVAVLMSVCENSSLLGSAGETALAGGRAICGVMLFTFALPLIKNAESSLEKTDKFLSVLMPQTCALLASSGARSTLTVLAPSSALISALAVRGVTVAVFPLLISSVILFVADGVFGEGKIEGVATLFKSIALWVSGGIFTLFSGIIAVQGLTAGVSDGISLRSVKYALSSSVPVIGSSVSESIGAVISGASAMKSASGIMGITVICGILFAPTVNLLAYAFSLKILSAVITPFSCNKTVKMLKNASECIKYAGITLFGTGVICFIFLGALILCGGNI